MDDLKSAPDNGAMLQGKQHQHITTAKDMGAAIVSNANPMEQNEMVKCINDYVEEQRMSEIESAQKALSYLSDSLEHLNNQVGKSSDS